MLKVAYYKPNRQLMALIEYVKRIAVKTFDNPKVLTDREFRGVIPYPDLEEHGLSNISSEYYPVAFCGGNFPPHIDPKLISTERDYKTVFWIVQTQSDDHLVHVQVGNESASLKKWQFVIFDGELVHSAQSDRRWYGISCQVPVLDVE